MNCIPDDNLCTTSTIWCSRCGCVLYQNEHQMTSGLNCDQGFALACIDTVDWN